MKVKILIVEDEMIIADNICDTLEELGYDALEPAINYTEAINTIEEQMPDLAILDIQLSGIKTGIDVAETISENYNFPYIFLTSNSDVATVNEAKRVSPSAFLVKPFTKEELYSSIEVALFNFTQKVGQINDENLIIKDALFFKDKGVFTKLIFEDIYYLKSDHVYVEVFLKNKKTLVIRASLNDVITKLNDSFIRVHRGYIINIKYLEAIDNNTLKVHKKNIPIGKKYRENLLKKINFI